MKVVGVTGSLASGKSLVADIFKRHGARVFDADAVSRAQLAKGKPLYRSVIQLFGRKILKKDASIDRRRLAEHVFSNPKDLRKLNLLIHPAVILEGMELIRRTKKKPGVLVLDVPLLFEAKMDRLADVIVVVATPANRMIRRAVERGIRPELAKKILSSQWPMKRKVARADYVISNSGSVSKLKMQVVKILKEINTGGS